MKLTKSKINCKNPRPPRAPGATAKCALGLEGCLRSVFTIGHNASHIAIGMDCRGGTAKPQYGHRGISLDEWIAGMPIEQCDVETLVQASDRNHSKLIQNSHLYPNFPWSQNWLGNEATWCISTLLPIHIHNLDDSARFVLGSADATNLLDQNGAPKVLFANGRFPQRKQIGRFTTHTTILSALLPLLTPPESSFLLKSFPGTLHCHTYATPLFL